MYDLPVGSLETKLTSKTKPSLIVELVKLKDDMRFPVTHMWFPQWFYEFITATTASKVIFDSLFNSDNSITIHVVQGLQVVVMAHCPDNAPSCFVGFPSSYNKKWPESCLYVRLSLALKTQWLINQSS